MYAFAYPSPDDPASKQEKGDRAVCRYIKKKTEEIMCPAKVKRKYKEKTNRDQTHISLNCINPHVNMNKSLLYMSLVQWYEKLR